MAELQPNDELLVNRDNVTYTQEQGTIMANLQGDDYLLINRDDATYKITGQDFIDSVIDPLELTVTIDNTTPAPGDTINAIASPAGGKQPYTAITYQWKQRSDDGLVTDIASATFSFLTITPEMAGFEIACEATVGDALGNSVTTLSDYTDAVSYQEEVDTPELITPPDGAGMGAGITPESGTITDVSVEGPDATMYGLRFDPGRKTDLTRNLGVGNRKTFTISTWVKKAGGTNSVSEIGILKVSNDDYTQFYYSNADGKVTFQHKKGGTSYSYETSETLQENIWTHVVLAVDTTQAASADRVKIYINGSAATVSDGGLSQNQDTYWNSGSEITSIGNDRKEYETSGSESYYLAGYLSDYYAVDGQALEPTAFGYALEDGTWAPLDSSVVTTNIGYKEPPTDTSPNYDQDWTSTVFADTGSVGNQGQGFDGDLSTYTFTTNNDGTLTFTPTTPIQDVTKVEVYRADTGNPDNSARLNSAGNFISFPQVTWTTLYEGPATTLTSLQVAGNPSANALLSAVRVNGRILIDGPADNSQVWSDGTQTGSLLSSSWKTAFNGKGIDAGGDNQVLAADNTTAELYFPSVLTGASSVVVHGISQTAAAKVNVIAGNDDFIEVTGLPTGSYGPGAAVNVSGRGGLKGVQVTSSGSNRGGLTAVVVDGLVLVDGLPTWNTSKVWSSLPTTATDGPFNRQDAFDGNLTTNAGPTTAGDGNFYEIDFSGTNITVASKLEVYSISHTDKDDGDNLKYIVNGVDATKINPGNIETGRIELDFTGELNTFRIENTGLKSAISANLVALWVDGEMLVDQGSIGANGFYLPFKADEPSIEVINDEGWEEVTTITAEPVLNNGALIAYSSSPIVWSCRAEVPGSGVQWYQSDDGINWIYQGTANDGPFGVTFESVPVKWICAGGSGTNARTIAGKNGETFKWTQWDTDDRFDKKQNTSTPGVLAATYNSIGLDASGEGNHFSDENFATGNTDEVWSATITNSNYGWAGFDGSENNWFANDNEVSTWTGSVEYTQLRIRLTSAGGNGNWGDFKINGVSQSPTTATKHWFTPTGITSPLTSIQIDRPSQTIGAQITKVEIDGKILIDKNIQDTVKDTPMKNYAVLEAGVNGNLGALANNQLECVSTLAVTTKVYAECSVFASDTESRFCLKNASTDIIANILGTNFTAGDLLAVSVDGSTGDYTFYKNSEVVDTGTVTTDDGVYIGGLNAAAAGDLTFNFGQQPFAASNVTHDIDAGTVEIDGETYSTLYQLLGSTTATLTIADAGTLDLIEGTPTMTAKVGGATGTYVSHTDTELVLGNTSGTWSVDSETAISDTELSIAAINPNDFVMTSSEFSATPLEATHGSSTWQVTEVSDTTYSSPVIDVTSESALTTYNASGLEGDTTYRARVKHTSANNVDSLWSEEVHQNIFKTEPALLDTPDATMYGLRTDFARNTNLSRTIGPISVATFSGWFKFFGDSGTINILSDDAGADYFAIVIGGKVYMSGSSGGVDSGVQVLPEKINKWVHLVIQKIGTEGKVYLNGTEQEGTLSGLKDALSVSNMIIGQVDLSIANTKSYISDFYFVENQILEPEAFGSLFPEDSSAPDRRWGPLDSSDVYTNVGDFGANGFHLPFKTNEPSTNWIGKTTPPASFNGDIENIFNGATALGSLGITDVPQNNKLVITNSFSDLISAGTWFGGRGSARIKIIGDTTVTSLVEVGVNGQSNLFTFTSPVTNVTSIEIESVAGDTIAIYGVEVNGELLINSSSISIDASGQGNNFYERSFAVGNTDEIWSNNLTGNFNAGYGPQIAFNGSIDDNAFTDSGSIVFDATSYNLDITSLALRFYANDTDTISVVTSDGTFAFTPPDKGQFIWFNCTGVTGTLQTITIEKNTGNTSLSAIQVNGSILVDKNIQDTVYDTPMRNAAILSSLGGAGGSLKNGNLELSHTSSCDCGTSFGVTPDKTLYFEFYVSSYDNTGSPTAGVGLNLVTSLGTNNPTTAKDGGIYYERQGNVWVEGTDLGVQQTFGEGDLIGISISSTAYAIYKNGTLVNNGTHTITGELSPYSYREGNGLVVFNMGQQPFAASNVTHDIDAGTVILTEPAFNYDQKWSDGLVNTEGGQVVNDLTNAFDGNLYTFAFSSGGENILTFTPGEAVDFTDSVRVWLRGPSQQARINGGAWVSSAGNPDVGAWVTIAEGSGTLTTVDVQMTAGSQTAINAYEVDGRILVDGPADNSQIWSAQTSTSVDESSDFYIESPLSLAFNGDTTNWATVRCSSNSPSISSAYFEMAAPFAGEAEMFTAGNSAQGVDFYVNGELVNNTISETMQFYSLGEVNEGDVIRMERGNQSDGSSAILGGVRIGGKLLIDRVDPNSYSTLFQTWDQWANYGAFFYNEQTDEVIQAFTLKRRYGLLGAKPEAGIYELAVQPNFAVAAYIKEDNTYVPIEDPAPRIAAAEAQAEAEIAVVKAQAATEVAAAEAEVRKYQVMLVRAACAWVVAKAYEAGDIIIYNGHVFRALEDNVATADNDPGDMDGTWEFLGLEEDAAPLAIDGYFPLYETEAASDAAGNGSSHTHTIDGVTYYMPDGGVTIYHGNYTGFAY